MKQIIIDVPGLGEIEVDLEFTVDAKYKHIELEGWYVDFETTKEQYRAIDNEVQAYLGTYAPELEAELTTDAYEAEADNAFESFYDR